MPREDEEAEEGSDQPKRKAVDQVPLGIRKPRSPKFDSSQFVDGQTRKDREMEEELERKAREGDLEAPDLHRDYEVQDGDEFDRHLEGISSVNALREMIAQAKEEVEEELGVTSKPFSMERMDQLMIFTREAVMGYGEDAGYVELKKRMTGLIEEDRREAEREMDRKKDAYLRSSGG